MNKIKVLIIDDSALVRQTLTKLLSSDPRIEVVGTAANPYVAVTKIKNLQPDVITLDIEMPEMDGLTFLKKLMAQQPIPVVVISSLAEKSTQMAIQALEYGAVEVLAKPKINTEELLEGSKIVLCDKIIAASMIKVRKKAFSIMQSIQSNKTAFSFVKNSKASENSDKVILIGASTGGPGAITELLTSLPIDCPGIVIVQHMPEMFTKQFAERLDGLCKIAVKEAKNNDPVLKGQALIAPGAMHTTLRKIGGNYIVSVKEGPLVNRHKPSVDVLFNSAACCTSVNAIGILMTGMGADGAQGLLEMRNSGAFTIAQDEKSCVVFGMPKEAIKLNAVDEILPLSQISTFIINQIKKNNNDKSANY